MKQQPKLVARINHITFNTIQWYTHGEHKASYS